MFLSQGLSSGHSQGGKGNCLIIGNDMSILRFLKCKFPKTTEKVTACNCWKQSRENRTAFSVHESGKVKHTSEYVKDAILDFFLLAKIRVDTTSLELAKGRMTNETKKEGMLVAVEKLSTASTRGSAVTAAIMVPKSNMKTAL